MKSSRPREFPRDTDETPFTPILRDLVRRVPGAYAVALVDCDGEAVDYDGAASPFDLRVASAHLQILLRQVGELGALGAPKWLVLRGQKQSLVARTLPEGYAIGLLLKKRAGFAPSRRAFAACEYALGVEAGWRLPRSQKAPRRKVGSAAAEQAHEEEIWHAVPVEADRRGRPKRVGRSGAVVEILGAVVGLPSSERGYRVRTSAGTELTLVREARNCWYSDDLPDDA